MFNSDNLDSGGFLSTRILRLFAEEGEEEEEALAVLEAIWEFVLGEKVLGR